MCVAGVGGIRPALSCVTGLSQSEEPHASALRLLGSLGLNYYVEYQMTHDDPVSSKLIAGNSSLILFH